MAISALDLLAAVESADREDDLDTWSRVFGERMKRVTSARACQLLRVVDGGARLESLGHEDVRVRDLLAAGHNSLDEEQRRRIYRSGATVVTTRDLYDGAKPPVPLSDAMREADVNEIVGMVAAPGVSFGLFLPDRVVIEARERQMLLALAHHVGASVVLRAAMQRDVALDGDLPQRLRGALEELERRRKYAASGDANAAASAVQFLGALAREGFAVVSESRVGGTRRIIAVRVKDSAGRALRTLDNGERDVLERLERGRSLKEIAYELDVAEATVSNRIARIRVKLGIDPRAELIRIAGAAREH